MHYPNVEEIRVKSIHYMLEEMVKKICNKYRE